MNHTEHVAWAVMLTIYSILKLLGTPAKIERYKKLAKMRLDELNRMDPEMIESRTHHQWDTEAVQEEAQTGSAGFHWFCSVATSAPLIVLAVRLLMTAA